MDDFVRNKLTEWKLSDWIEAFEAQEIDKDTLYHLDDQEINQLITKAGPRVKFNNKLKLLKEEQNATQPQKEAVNTSVQDSPSKSEKEKEIQKRKRKSDHLQGEFSQWQPAPKHQYNCAAGSQSETEILSDVKDIMRRVSEGLHGRDKLSAFLKDKIKDLETEKRHLFVASCSTVWIVTEMNQAASEKETWEILENARSLLRHGGECQQIHFICTKSDHEKPDDLKKIKSAVMNEFKRRKLIKNHFSEDCFKVFTVSSTEFLKGENVNPDHNEIPKLKEILKNLNDAHSETLNYVSGAYGILSLIQGARSGEVVEQKNDLYDLLEGNLSIQLNQVKKAIGKIIKAFEQRLSKGVEKSQNLCEKKLKSFLYPSKMSDRAFHGTLKSAVRNDGVQKPKKGKPKNLNMTLASYLTESIDEKFRKTFPNNIKCGHFNGAIDAFSLSTDSLIEKYKDVELQLIFLQTEENKIKAKLNKTILTQKKLIYNSLTETIKDNMKKCYREAAAFEGRGTLKKMRHTIERHVHSKKCMFEEAKNVMLEQLSDLKETVLRTLEKTMKESIDFSLKTEACSLPDVSDHLQVVKKHYDELHGGQDEKNS
ncbi:nuclear GTPase SLIP-GC-like isoform X2 [Oreochromis aureus]|uniref:nuclear GTPase SLIP-GC-like isoform X2 n=1 Tax=Oreochromis aureus TaxID=47969 RepID=UPI001953DDBE|nr:nuclear GTPase SLIP-GC-like isoform X2 [Oreochromis aureus]